MTGMSRRGFLLATAGAAAATALTPSKRRLLQMNGYPIDAETPLELLGETYITPNDLFFIRHHWNPVFPDARTWKLAVDGEVERPLALSLADLKAMPQTSVDLRAAVRRQRPGAPSADRAGRAVEVRRRRQREVDGSPRPRPARQSGFEGRREAPPHVRHRRAAGEGAAVPPQRRDGEDPRRRHRRPGDERRAAAAAPRRTGAARRAGLGGRSLDEVARAHQRAGRASDRLLHGRRVPIPEDSGSGGCAVQAGRDDAGHRALRQVEHHLDSRRRPASARGRRSAASPSPGRRTSRRSRSATTSA